MYRQGPLAIHGRLSRIATLLTLLFVAVFPLTARGQQGNIGIYSDPARSSCSLSDQESTIKAYVVANTQSGMTLVRFAAPTPSCFNAVWLSDELPGGFVSIGDSQNDIAIATGLCMSGATHVLTMTFQKTSSTATCCEFPIVVPMEQTDVTFTDCAFVEHPITPSPAYVNGDVSCPCDAIVDLPPSTPSAPSPTDGAFNQPVFLSLGWLTVDPEGQPLHHDVYFGETADPPLLASNITLNQQPVGPLEFETTYYWKVVTKDPAENTAAGPVWSFSTVPQGGNAPPIPTNPRPANGAVDQARAVYLQWSDGTGTGLIYSYDVYFGTTPTPPFAGNTSNKVWSVSGLALDTTYYWKVVANGQSVQSPGPLWSFHTTATNLPPGAPMSPDPPHLSTDNSFHPTLQWSAIDPDAQPLEFDVYFGTDADPPFFAHTTGPAQALSLLSEQTDYYWRVVAIDPDAASTSGPVWKFRTRTNVAPTVPTLVAPGNGANVPAAGLHLKWSASDPHGDPLSYALYLGTTNPPPLLVPITTSNDVVVEDLTDDTTYYWKIVAKEVEGLTTEGPVWSFHTTQGLPPAAPHSPSPAHNSFNMLLTLTLGWSSSDPEGLPLTYDVYFGPAFNPVPLVASNWTGTSYPVTGLSLNSYYEWRIVARDVDGNETSGVLWRFRTGSTPDQPPRLGLYADAEGNSCTLSDVGPAVRNVYVVLDGPSSYTSARFKAQKPLCFSATWIGDSSPYPSIGDSQTDIIVAFGSCINAPMTVMTITYMSTGTTNGCCQFPLLDVPDIGKSVTDCSFAEIMAQNSPVLKISSNGGCAPCGTAGSLSFAAAEDTCRAAIPGPAQRTYDLMLSPEGTADDGSVEVTFSPLLTFVSCERGGLTQDWTTFDYTVDGNKITIHGVAHPGHNPATSGVFARLTFAGNCCDWSTAVVLGLSNPTGDFAGLALIDKQLVCRYEPDGDVNDDGDLTVADAQCALDVYLYTPHQPPSGCAGAGASMRADVDCSGSTTPADAYCIFRHWLDQSCTFCSGGIAERATTSSAARLSLRVVHEGDELVVILNEQGLEQVSALGLELQYPPELGFERVDAARPSAFAALEARVVERGRLRIGAYANGAAAPAGDGDIFAIRFRAPTTARGIVTAGKFVDDLAGAPDVSITLDGAAVTPAISHVVLHQNVPNPFNPRTSIRFELPGAMRVRLLVFDVQGRAVRTLLDGQRGAGDQTVEWDGTNDRGSTVATGIYFYVLDAGGKRYQHKMVMLK